MHTLLLMLTLGVLGVVFGLAFIMPWLIFAGLLWGPVHDAEDRLFGWRMLTCPQTRTAVRIRVARLPRGSSQRLVVLSCTRFGEVRPNCHQACVAPRPAAALA